MLFRSLYIQVMLAAMKLAKEKYNVPTIILYDHEISDSNSKDHFRAIGFSDDAIIERLKEGGASVIDVSLEKEKGSAAPISIPDDGHPTPLANRMRAVILKNYLQQNMAGILASLN